MATLQFILLVGAAVVGIVWAIDIPTTKWEGFKPTQKKPLWAILHDAVTQEIRGTDEIKPPASTYTGALQRAKERGRETSRSKL